MIKSKRCDITFIGVDKKIVKNASVFASANTLNRVLHRLPSNKLTPSSFVSNVKNMIKKHDSISMKEIGEKELKEIGANSILAVGAAGGEKPRILYLNYKGSDKKSSISLIGKGVCYDTGGVNNKDPEGMSGMKNDMAGAGMCVIWYSWCC